MCLVVPDRSIQHRRYLHLDELFVEDIIWVDEYEGLLDATSQIEGCKVIGVDSEWKPNHVKGSKPNKVMCYESPNRSISMLLCFHFFFSVVIAFMKLCDMIFLSRSLVLCSPVTPFATPAAPFPMKKKMTNFLCLRLLSCKLLLKGWFSSLI